MTTTNGKTTRDALLGIRIDRDVNEYGERCYTVTPTYRLRCGTVVAIPDTKGWPTLALARAEADRIANR